MLEEETDPLKKADAKPSLAEEAVAAAKAASAAASDVARVSQEMMITKSEGRCLFFSFLWFYLFPTKPNLCQCFLSERKYFEDLTRLLGVQVQEIKSLSNNIRSLEGKCSSFIEKRRFGIHTSIFF